MTRRSFLSRSCAAFLGLGLGGGAAQLFAADSAPDEFVQELMRLEKVSGGRLGVAVLETKTGTVTGYRMDERFPLCSTFKVLAVGALLAEVDAGREHLSRRIVFTKADLIDYSPATQDHVGGTGMTLAELCAAAITLSDNTAANLILVSVVGPAGVTRYARSLGDKITRLDRNDPGLNHATPGDPRDTTTPVAMLGSLNALVLGTALSPASRQQLITWLKATKTGDTRLRAGLPKDWPIGDKTGTNNNSANDIAVIWPPQHAPLVVAAYLTEAKVSPEKCNEILAAVGRAIAKRAGE